MKIRSEYNIKVLTDGISYETVGKYILYKVKQGNEISLSTTLQLSDKTVENNKVIYDAATIRPIYSIVNKNVRGKDVILEAVYKKKTINLSAKVSKSKHTKKLSCNSEVYDNIQIYELITSFDFEKQKKYTISILNIDLALAEEYDVELYGEENIVLNDKNYKCLRIALYKSVDSTEKQFILVTRESEPTIIKAINSNQIMEYVSKEYIET